MCSNTQEARDRFERERASYDGYYETTGNSRDLLLSDFDKARYQNPSASTIFPRECVYQLLQPVKGKRVLEMGCGVGRDATLLAYYGGDVSAYDLSSVAVDIARRCAQVNGVSERVRLLVARSLEGAFENEVFDRICGFSVLHHIPLDGFAEQVYRRLLPKGVAVFFEPVCNSRVLALVRSMIPYRDPELTEDEMPLNDRVITDLAREFDRSVVRKFRIFARLKCFISNRRRLVRGLHRIDDLILKSRFAHRFASEVVVAFYRDE